MARSFLLQTQNPATIAIGRHAMGGRAVDYPALTLPTCNSCGQPVTVLFKLDFDDPPLRELGAWSGMLYGLTCANCQPSGFEPVVFWDYGERERPLYWPGTKLECFDKQRVEYELTPLFLKPYSLPVSHPGYSWARVGGEPFQTAEVERPECPKCLSPMRFLLQLSESFDYRPRQLSPAGEHNELGFTTLHYWYACADCSVVASFELFE